MPGTDRRHAHVISRLQTCRPQDVGGDGDLVLARGVSIGAQVFPYSAFRSFFIVDEDAFSNITLTSTNRFMPNVSIYYAPEDEPAIVGFLSQHLPIEQGRIDRVERMMHRLRP